VSDIEAAARFYAGLLEDPGRRVWTNRHYFDCGGTIVACAAGAGAVELSEVAVQSWGERSFYARDPFGNPICFVDSGTLFTGE
jgi:hypothetical protein